MIVDNWPCYRLLLFVALIVSVTVPAARAEEEVAEGVRRGALAYRVYCQSCHGVEGQGDGPVAADLKHQPPDLSRLARRAGGEFPAVEVRHKIDGRDPVASHGPSDMPVWGMTFELRGDVDPRQQDQRINDLVEYLRSLQRSSEVDRVDQDPCPDAGSS